MSRNLSSNYQEIPPNSIAYDYDQITPPFTRENTAALDSIRDFLSESELAQARRLESVYFNPVVKGVCGTLIPGLRAYPDSSCLYVGRFRDGDVRELLSEFLDAVYRECPMGSLGGVHKAGFRVTTPDSKLYYPLKFHGDLKAWTDRMLEVAKSYQTTMGWFERGKFCLTDGRRFAFGDLQVDRLKGGEALPPDW